MDEKREFVELKNARVDEQRAVMEQIIEDGVCPFCPENLRRYHTQPVLREGAYWILTFNQWPYEHTKHHLLAIAKKHIEHLNDLPEDAGAELIEHFKWAAQEYEMHGGGIAMRFGAPHLSGGTVLHLHAQLIHPDTDAPDYEPTRIKIGKPKM